MLNCISLRHCLDEMGESMVNRVKVGVLGVGALGRHHARLYKQCDAAELIGIYDLNTDRAKEIADEIGTVVYEDPAELADLVDGLSIAVPTNYHRDVAVAMLERGKHLLIEKPITETLEQAQELLDLAKAKNLIVQVGHVERFNPALLALGQMPLNPMFIEAHRLAVFNPRGTDVSVILDLMIHDLDIVLSLVQSDVKFISASGVAVVSNTADICNARIEFENGCVANLTASRISGNHLF